MFTFIYIRYSTVSQAYLIYNKLSLQSVLNLVYCSLVALYVQCFLSLSVLTCCALSSAGAGAPNPAAEHSRTPSSTSTATESESDLTRRSAEGGLIGVPALRRVSSEKGRIVPPGGGASGQTAAAGEAAATRSSVHNSVSTPAATPAAASAVSTPVSSGYSSQKTSSRSAESSPPNSAAPPTAVSSAVVSTAAVSVARRPQSNAGLPVSVAPSSSSGQNIVSSASPLPPPVIQSRQQSMVTHVYASNSKPIATAAPQNGQSRASPSPSPSNPTHSAAAIPVRRPTGAAADAPLENSCDDTSSTLTTGSPPRPQPVIARPLPTPVASQLQSQSSAGRPLPTPLPEKLNPSPSPAPVVAKIAPGSQLNNLSASPKQAPRKNSQSGQPERPLQSILPNKSPLTPVSPMNRCLTD